MCAKQAKQPPERPGGGRAAAEASAIGLGFIGLFFLLSLISRQSGSGENLFGIVGDATAWLLLRGAGYGAYALAAFFGFLAVMVFLGQRVSFPRLRSAALFGLVLCLCGLLHLALPDNDYRGGLAGEALGSAAAGLFSQTGGILVFTSLLAVCFIGATGAGVIGPALRLTQAAAPIVGRGGRLAVAGGVRTARMGWRLGGRLAGAAAERLHSVRADQTPLPEPEPAPGPRRRKPKLEGSEPVSPPQEEATAGEAPPEAAAGETPRRKRREPEIISSSARRADAATVGDKPLHCYDDYQLPALSLLDYEEPKDVQVREEMLRENARKLEKALADYNIQGEVREIHPGPVVTMYEFAPAPGIRANKIAILADDLAMALAAVKVRIVAPIPGKSVVGIEVPNESQETVYLREILSDAAFAGNRSPLAMGLGKDIAGRPVITDLQKMPHLLAAGTTGSGKSVSVNAMILSILFRNRPDDVKFILVDPKRLEFGLYADIPHLLLPVVTDPRKATVALNWAVREMDRRYELMQKVEVRHIQGYNKLAEARNKGETAPAAEPRVTIVRKDVPAGPPAEPEQSAPAADETGPLERLPYIVIIIDEFADLMMVAAKDVENAVARLSQLARAAGIHLILATQRPSTDVITGLIKNNFPVRISMRVAAKVDSRVVLDQQGAENLLGRGDMLFLPPGSSTLERIHGAFVSDEEIKRVCGFIRGQASPRFHDEILQLAAMAEENQEEEAENDELYDQAVAVVCNDRKASISYLQRKLQVGYNRAARMIERMEKEGVIGPQEGTRPREIYGRKIEFD